MKHGNPSTWTMTFTTEAVEKFEDKLTGIVHNCEICGTYFADSESEDISTNELLDGHALVCPNCIAHTHVVVGKRQEFEEIIGKLEWTDLMINEGEEKLYIFELFGKNKDLTIEMVDHNEIELSIRNSETPEIVWYDCRFPMVEYNPKQDLNKVLSEITEKIWEVIKGEI